MKKKEENAKENPNGRRAVTTEDDGKPKCMGCFGAGDEGECCNTCEQVRAAYRKKGWAFDPSGVEQCIKEGFVVDVLQQHDAKEGCNIYGYVEVPTVAGRLVFAPGSGFQHAVSHVDDVAAFTLSKLNMTHRINSLSFGHTYPV